MAKAVEKAEVYPETPPAKSSSKEGANGATRGETVAKVSKRWFTIRDTYGIDIAAGQDDGLILAMAVAIDEMAHDPDEDGKR